MFFFFLLMFSIYLGISSSHFFNFWFALEMNVMSFLGFIQSSGVNRESGVVLMYFIPQAFASMLMLSSLIFLSVSLSKFFILVFFFSLIFKLGTFPLHYWFLGLVSLLELKDLFVLSTLQKLLPFLGIFYMKLNLMWFLVVGGLLVSIMGGLSQVSLSLLLGFSSIYMLSWLLSSLDYFYSILYLVFYSFSLWFIVYFFSQMPSSYNFFYEHMSSDFKFYLFLGFWSMMGVPPFLTFLSKLYILKSIFILGNYILGGLILWSAVFYIYIYMGFSLKSLVLESNVSVFNISLNTSYLCFFMYLTFCVWGFFL